MRVLASVSPHFTSRSTIAGALNIIDTTQPGPHTLVHGNARAERSIATLAKALGWTLEPHPADWTAECTDQCRHRPRVDDFCAAAGAYRNTDMVALGADICLAFFAAVGHNGNVIDCSKKAAAAGIAVHPFTSGTPAKAGR